MALMGEGTLSLKRYSGYALITVAYMVGILLISSMPDHGTGSDDLLSVIGTRGNQYPALQLLGDLLHLPLYGGLAFFFLQAVTRGNAEARFLWHPYVITLLATATFAILDEGYQSFVPGRYASLSDLLLNLMGIGGVLLYLRFRTSRERHS